MKAQSAVEYLWAYVWTFIVLAVVISAIVINDANRPSTASLGNSQSECYINPEVNCQEAALLSNSTGSKAVVVFTNGLGTRIDLPTNTFDFIPSQMNSNQVFNGGCVPANVVPGGTAVCNATVDVPMKVGSEIEPTFSIGYEICQANGSCAPQIYNAIGSGTIFVSPYAGVNTYTLGNGIK